MRGLIVGFILAVPVGPIAILCMRRTIVSGVSVGFATGLGGAVADGVYGALAAFGVSAVADFIGHYRTEFRLGGGIFILFLAWQTATSHPRPPERAATRSTRIEALITGFVLTLTNPMTIVGFAAVFAGFGVGGALGNTPAATLLVLGVIIGSAGWWFALCSFVAAVHHLISDRLLHIINIWAAGALALCGVYALITGIMGLPGALLHL